MKLLFYSVLILNILAFNARGQNRLSGSIVEKSFPRYKNIWTSAPARIPSNVSVDAPLMGNGDMLSSLGFDGQILRFYLSKNDFWRLKSQGDGLSGPRMAGFFDISINGFSTQDFSAEQSLGDGLTTCKLKNTQLQAKISSWISATDNTMVIRIQAQKGNINFQYKFNTPENTHAKVEQGDAPNSWLTRSFIDEVDIPTTISMAFKTIGKSKQTLKEGEDFYIVIAIESKFKKENPLDEVQSRLAGIRSSQIKKLKKNHENWWQNYWNKSTVTLTDTLLEKAWYQVLYTMGACSRDTIFPPAIFGWISNDKPGWNGDYHLNYNFQAPFYALASANHLEQATPHDAPLIDFIPRGKWYTKEVTQTGGILFPVGIGPLGIEVTRNFPNEGYLKHGSIEKGGLFFGQRSNALYGLVNMAQYWRCTYNKKYGEKIYPYISDVVAFWEDYLKLENNRYVIYGDAIHEGSGKNKNPILTLGLLRNALNLIIDLSSELKKDESKLPKWKDMLARLSEYPVQERNGRQVFRYTEEGVSWWNDNGLGIQHIYPSNGITLSSNPTLLEIARNTIDDMQRWKDMNTTSSFYMAAIRIGYNPEKVVEEIRKYSQRTYPNGFQKNNPHGIENSCTVTNAIDEMLCMSVDNIIRLFQGYPSAFDAKFTNLRTWGAFLVSAERKSGVVSGVKIISSAGKTCTFQNPWNKKSVLIFRNGKKGEQLEGEQLKFNTSENETIELKPVK